MKEPHTPGPWVIDTDTPGTEVCTVYCTSHPNSFVYVRGPVGNLSTGRDQNMANAHLIAAAPELLAALVALHAVASVEEDKNYAAVANAAAVISKATGATP